MAILNYPFTYRRKTGVKTEPILKNSQNNFEVLRANSFCPLFWTKSMLKFGHRNP